MVKAPNFGIMIVYDTVDNMGYGPLLDLSHNSKHSILWEKNITDFLKALITTDSIKIFSITFCSLVTVYCTCKIAKDAFRIVS